MHVRDLGHAMVSAAVEASSANLDGPQVEYFSYQHFQRFFNTEQIRVAKDEL